MVVKEHFRAWCVLIRVACLLLVGGVRISGGWSWSCWPALIVGLDACMPRVVCRAAQLGTDCLCDVVYIISLLFLMMILNDWGDDLMDAV